MDNNICKELCIEAVNNARRGKNMIGMLLYSDRDNQFTSEKFRATLDNYGIIQSMISTGRCYDNARTESFFATLKKEKLYRIPIYWMPMAQVKTIVFRFIMIYYNRQRIIQEILAGCHLSNVVG